MIDDVGLKNLEKLHQLKTDGIISEADFEAAKAKLLAQAPSSTPKAARAPAASFDGTLPEDDDHLAWMLLPLRRYADFTGRSSRREFWMFLLFANLVSLALMVLALAIGLDLAFAIWLLGVLGILVPLIAVQVRRFHDQGRSGWFAALNLIPYIGGFIVLAFMFVPGQEEDNQYGPAPYG